MGSWITTWRALRWYRLAVYISAGAVVGSGLLAIKYASWEVPTVILLFLFIAVFFVVSWKITEWPCPRCGARYFSRQFLLPTGIGTGFRGLRACANCGLPWNEAKKSPWAPA